MSSPLPEEVPAGIESVGGVRGSIAAVNVDMAVQARTAVGLDRRALPREERLPAVPRAHMARAVVAVLAQVGDLLDQKALVDAPVYRMARRAILVDRGMLEHEGTPLLGVALVAELVHAVRLDLGRAHGAVGIMAVGAGDPSFDQRMMRPSIELGLLVEVALGAYCVLPRGRVAEAREGGAVPCRGLWRAVERVAVAARHVLLLVDSGIPHGKLGAVFVTREADRRFLLSGLAFPKGREPPNALAATRFRMVCSGAVAGLTSLAVVRIARDSLLPVRALGHELRLVFVATQAGIGTGIAGSSHVCGPGGRGDDRYQKHEPNDV